MASIYEHGIYTKEQPTGMVAPVMGTAGLQVIVGTAPVHMLADPAAAAAEGERDGGREAET